MEVHAHPITHQSSSTGSGGKGRPPMVRATKSGRTQQAQKTHGCFLGRRRQRPTATKWVGAYWQYSTRVPFKTVSSHIVHCALLDAPLLAVVLSAKRDPRSMPRPPSPPCLISCNCIGPPICSHNPGPPQLRALAHAAFLLAWVLAMGSAPTATAEYVPNDGLRHTLPLDAASMLISDRAQWWYWDQGRLPAGGGPAQW